MSSVSDFHWKLAKLADVLGEIPPDGLTPEDPEKHWEYLKGLLNDAKDLLLKVEADGQMHPRERREIRDFLEEIADTYIAEECPRAARIKYVPPMDEWIRYEMQRCLVITWDYAREP